MSDYQKPLVIKPDLIIVKPITTNFNPANPFGNGKDLNYFAVLFYVLLTAMSVRQDTVITQSKEITMNASLQNILNKRNAEVTFAFLPPNAKTDTINQVQEENTQASALREDFQNALITARQNAQVMMTQTSTSVNFLQEDASEDSRWLDTLNTVFKVINQMSPGSG